MQGAYVLRTTIRPPPQKNHIGKAESTKPASPSLDLLALCPHLVWCAITSAAANYLRESPPPSLLRLRRSPVSWLNANATVAPSVSNVVQRIPREPIKARDEV